MNLMKSSFIISGVLLLLLAVQSCKKEEAPRTYPVTDMDGNGYDTITFGSQTWLVQNLRTTKYSNGDTIGTTYPQNKDISGESEPRYQWPPFGIEAQAATKGRLYSWYAVTDSRGLCPTGWHVPSHSEWTTLGNYLISNNFGYEGSGSDIAKAMASENGWTVSNTSGTPGNDPATNNMSGFSAIAVGTRKITNLTADGQIASFWTTTDYYASTARVVEIWASNSELMGNVLNEKYCGASVRCVKD